MFFLGSGGEACDFFGTGLVVECSHHDRNMFDVCLVYSIVDGDVDGRE